MKKVSGVKIFLAVFVSIIIFLFLNFLFSIQNVIADGLQGYIRSITNLLFVKLLISVLAGSLVLLFNGNHLDNIEKVQVGNSQHGSARFMNEKEKRQNYTYVPDGKEKVPGFIVGREGNTWIVDTSD